MRLFQNLRIRRNDKGTEYRPAGRFPTKYRNSITWDVTKVIQVRRVLDDGKTDYFLCGVSNKGGDYYVITRINQNDFPIKDQDDLERTLGKYCTESKLSSPIM